VQGILTALCPGYLCTGTATGVAKNRRAVARSSPKLHNRPKPGRR